MREVRRTVPAPGDLGNGVIGVPRERDLVLDVRLEAVMDGVLVSGTVTAVAEGECVRCLDPLHDRVEVDVQELFLHSPAEDGDGDDEQPLLDGDLADLEPTVRDALVPALPFQPVCDPDCPGLCSRCGARLKDDPDHAHEDVDPRWSALAGLTDQLGAVGAQDDPPAADRADGDRPQEEKS